MYAFWFGQLCAFFGCCGESVHAQMRPVAERDVLILFGSTDSVPRMGLYGRSLVFHLGDCLCHATTVWTPQWLGVFSPDISSAADTTSRVFGLAFGVGDCLGTATSWRCRGGYGYGSDWLRHLKTGRLECVCASRTIAPTVKTETLAFATIITQGASVMM